VEFEEEKTPSDVICITKKGDVYLGRGHLVGKKGVASYSQRILV
jgi:hypothetical protein